MDRQQLQTYHCPRWQELPSLGLYMDQVLQVLGEATAPLRPAGEPACTATMINNYVKLKVLAAVGKEEVQSGPYGHPDADYHAQNHFIYAGDSPDSFAGAVSDAAQ